MGLHRVTLAARSLAVLGTIAAVAGIGKLHASLHEQSYAGWSRYGWAAMYIFALCVSAYAAGIPAQVRRSETLLAAVGAVTGAAIVVSLIQLFAGSALLPRFVVFTVPLVLVPWYMACASLARRGKDDTQEWDRIFLVGCADDADALRDDLARSPERQARLLGSVVPEEVSAAGGRPAPLAELVAEARATVLVLAREAQSDECIVAQAADLHLGGIRLRTLTGFCEEWLGKLPISELERVSLMFDISDVHRKEYARIKRIIDVFGGLLGTAALALILPLVTLGNLLANRGSLFFRQARVGRDGAEFEILKLRTMRTSSAGTEGDWTKPGDPRITPFGRFLRRTHLDELPQVVNILRGELTLVGPRPEQPRYVTQLTAKLRFYELRHLVRPGLTGWAQVKYPYGSNEGDALEKLQYDFFYLRHQGIALDLRVMKRTLRHMFTLGGQ